MWRRALRVWHCGGKRLWFTAGILRNPRQRITFHFEFVDNERDSQLRDGFQKHRVPPH